MLLIQMQGNMSALNAIEMHPKKRPKWQILCRVCFTTIKNATKKKKANKNCTYIQLSTSVCKRVLRVQKSPWENVGRVRRCRVTGTLV